MIKLKSPFLITSLLLHLLVLLAVSQIKIKKPLEAISIEVIQRTTPSLSTKSKESSENTLSAKTASAAKTQKKSASIHAKKINPFLFTSYLENSVAMNNTVNGNSPAKSSDNSEWHESYFYLNDGMTDYNDLTTSEVQFLQSFWQQVNSNVEDNPFLSEYGHIGTIFFQFNLDNEGQLINESLKVSSMDSVLKVIAIRAIRKTISDQKFILPKKQVTLGMKFTWDSYEACPNLKGIHSYYLSFCHYAEYKMKQFTTSEKVNKYVSSLAYGFDAIDEIKKYKQEEYRRDTRFDPFEKYKNDPDWYL